MRPDRSAAHLISHCRHLHAWRRCLGLIAVGHRAGISEWGGAGRFDRSAYGSCTKPRAPLRRASRASRAVCSEGSVPSVKLFGERRPRGLHSPRPPCSARHATPATREAYNKHASIARRGVAWRSQWGLPRAATRARCSWREQLGWLRQCQQTANSKRKSNRVPAALCRGK